ncbi:MAG: hypothetical protein PHE88_10260 [Elusimicrobia bacterium]|nr:hypothetical protein [Elusimicrobiota bacterium]
MKNFNKFLLVFLIFQSFNLLISQSLHSNGISTNYADIFIANLSINKEYNLRISYNQPLKVMNRSDKKIEVRIVVQVPLKDSLKSDLEPIKDITWISVLPDRYFLEPHQTGVSDVIIKIPKDKKIRGHKFQVNLNICGYPAVEKKGGITFVPSLLSKLKFSIKK